VKSTPSLRCLHITLQPCCGSAARALQEAPQGRRSALPAVAPALQSRGLVIHPEETTMTTRALEGSVPDSLTAHLVARLLAYVAWVALALLAAL
jgi:hypothetical protein